MSLRHLLITCSAATTLVLMLGVNGSASKGQREPVPCRARTGLHSLPAELKEASGAAASRRHAGIVWTHNDSGGPVVYAIDGTGREVGRVRITGADAIDWESVAVAPCAQGSCLFIADIGDNEARRDHITIYRVPEPAVDANASEPAVKLDARYPDGPRNAEAIIVLPPARIHIVTKGDTSPVEVYRFAEGAAPGAVTVLERVRVLGRDKVKPKDRVTGADTTPDGTWVLLRTTTALTAYDTAGFLASGEPRWQMALGSLAEPQGEGVAVDAQGTVILTSEGRSRPTGTIAWLECAFDHVSSSALAR